MLYPTKEQILAEIEKIGVSQEELALTRRWKEKTYDKQWKGYSTKEKLDCLAELIFWLDGFSFPGALVRNRLETVNRESYQYSYNPRKKTINLDMNHPSILSTLHEYGHHLYGTSELKACAWSVNVFSRCFPKEFARLHWEGHMLKK
jgi:hypothetical protein